jgi:N-hydroxyarylamine O-acetyltransferase
MSAPGDPIDLDAYFTRIGFSGPRTATEETLFAIQSRHSSSIPFENLDVLLGRGIRIDLPSIEQKLIHQRRGGYCFEQNGLLAAALRALGFEVTPLIARVRWQVPAEVATPQTHMLLRVRCGDREYLADAGFGSMSLGRPLLLEFDREQTEVSLEPRRLIRRDDFVVQQACVENVWSDVYIFRLEPAADIDFEVGNWFTSTHPQSRFKQNLIVARLAGDRRFTILNREFTIRDRTGAAEKRMLRSSEELIEVLSRFFGLQLPSDTCFDVFS